MNDRKHAQRDNTPELYDIEHGLAQLAAYRRKRDELTRGQVHLADSLAMYVDRHLAAEEQETAGRAILIAAASAMSLLQEGAMPEIVLNVLAFAGARLIRDGRDWKPGAAQ